MNNRWGWGFGLTALAAAFIYVLTPVETREYGWYLCGIIMGMFLGWMLVRWSDAVRDEPGDLGTDWIDEPYSNYGSMTHDDIDAKLRQMNRSTLPYRPPYMTQAELDEHQQRGRYTPMPPVTPAPDESAMEWTERWREWERDNESHN